MGSGNHRSSCHQVSFCPRKREAETRSGNHRSSAHALVRPLRPARARCKDAPLTLLASRHDAGRYGLRGRQPGEQTARLVVGTGVTKVTRRLQSGAASSRAALRGFRAALPAARGLRILAADFSILVSAFEFPSGAGIWDASHFRFLDSRCKSRVGDGQEMTSFPVSDSDFPILGANPGSVKGRRLHHSRFRILISRFPVQNRPSPHGVSGEFISRFLIPLSIGT